MKRKFLVKWGRERQSKPCKASFRTEKKAIKFIYSNSIPDGNFIDFRNLKTGFCVFIDADREVEWVSDEKEFDRIFVKF